MFLFNFNMLDVFFRSRFLNFILTDLTRLYICDAKTLLNWQMFYSVCNNSNTKLTFNGIHVNFGFI